MPTLFAQRRWRFLADLVNGLGPTSRMVSAMLNDPERARDIAQAINHTDQDDTPTTLRDQTPEAIALHAIYNLLVHALGGKQTWPEPVTAVDQAREDLAIEKAWDVIAVMTPWALNR